MGKHKKDKKRKKHKKKKYSSNSKEEKKRNYDSSSEEEKIVRQKKRRWSSTDSHSSEDSKSPVVKSKPSQSVESDRSSSYTVESKPIREEWMNMSTAFQTVSNIDRKLEREHKKKLEREKDQYDPNTCDRELNPYWKSGGGGLPSFKKPVDSDEEDVRKKHTYRDQKNFKKRESNWKKPRENENRNLTQLDVQNQVQSTAKALGNKSVLDSSKETHNDNEVFTEKELNILASKLVKAEIMGDAELVSELKNKLEKARESLKNNTKIEDVVLTRTDSQGRTQPLKLCSEYGEASFHKKKKKVETHVKGERVRYFADDDKYSLKQMFENEKYNTVEASNREFSRMVGKIRKNDDMDDIFSDNIRKKESDIKMDIKNRDKAIQDHQKVSKSLNNCNKCIQSNSIKKHLMISMGETAYLALPGFEPLTDGHCIIVPIRHVPCTTLLDENEWTEILNIKKSLIKLFSSKNEVVIFFESAKYLHNFPHMSIECVPLPKEEGDMAPIYFKKAIDESEFEWTQNKKLVSLCGRDVRKAVPKGLPYFFVTFGIHDGFAHVIEDKQLFPSNFAQEIIGGMLDLHHSKWKRPKNESFDEQSKRVLQFSTEWKSYDCTTNMYE